MSDQLSLSDLTPVKNTLQRSRQRFDLRAKAENAFTISNVAFERLNLERHALMLNTHGTDIYLQPIDDNIASGSTQGAICSRRFKNDETKAPLKKGKTFRSSKLVKYLADAGQGDMVDFALREVELADGGSVYQVSPWTDADTDAQLSAEVEASDEVTVEDSDDAQGEVVTEDAPQATPDPTTDDSLEF